MALSPSFWFTQVGGYAFTQSSESEWSGTLSDYTFDGANIEGGAGDPAANNNGIRSDDTFPADMAFDLTWAVDIPNFQSACGVFNSSAAFRLHVCLYQGGDQINSVQWGPAN